METKTVHQNNLTSECWNVQIWGIEACETCSLKGTEDCGGKEIIKNAKNEKGLSVPIN